MSEKVKKECLVKRVDVRPADHFHTHYLSLQATFTHSELSHAGRPPSRGADSLSVARYFSRADPAASWMRPILLVAALLAIAVCGAGAAAPNAAVVAPDALVASTSTELAQVHFLLHVQSSLVANLSLAVANYALSIDNLALSVSAQLSKLTVLAVQLRDSNASVAAGLIDVSASVVALLIDLIDGVADFSAATEEHSTSITAQSIDLTASVADVSATVDNSNTPGPAAVRLINFSSSVAVLRNTAALLIDLTASINNSSAHVDNISVLVVARLNALVNTYATTSSSAALSELSE